MAYASLEYGKQICAALGISPNDVRGFRLTLDVSEPVTLDIEMYPGPETLQAVLDGLAENVMRLNLIQENGEIVSLIKEVEETEQP